MENPREVLERLIRDRGDDYASLSRLIGRNAAYVQQFIHRGVPRKLAEDDRRLLARYFAVDEQLLGAPPPVLSASAPAKARAPLREAVVMVPQLALGASAGPGALGGDEQPQGHIGFEAAWLRGMSSNPKALSIIQVAGDSMIPTLADGDDILVDRADAADRIRDGIYVLRADDGLIVKRIAINPVDRRFSVCSDNAAYPDWNDVDPAAIAIVGRVIWTGRRIK